MYMCIYKYIYIYLSICASYHALSIGLLQNDGSPPRVQMAVYMYMHTVESLFGLFGLRVESGFGALDSVLLAEGRKKGNIGGNRGHLGNPKELKALNPKPSKSCRRILGIPFQDSRSTFSCKKRGEEGGEGLHQRNCGALSLAIGFLHPRQTGLQKGTSISELEGAKCSKVMLSGSTLDTSFLGGILVVQTIIPRSLAP